VAKRKVIGLFLLLLEMWVGSLDSSYRAAKFADGYHLITSSNGPVGENP